VGIHVCDKMTDAVSSFGNILVLMKVDFFFLEGADPPFGDITDPDLIPMTDLKVFEQVAPRFIPLKRLCCSTRTLDADQQIIVFHQPSDASGPNAVSLTHEELGDTSIAVPRIRPSKFFYFSTQNRFGRIRFGLIIETAAVDTEGFDKYLAPNAPFAMPKCGIASQITLVQLR